MMRSDTEPKFCKDCKHFSPAGGIGTVFGGVGWPEFCSHPKNMSEREMVRGYRHPLADPADLRKPEGACGEAGAMFEAKPPEPPPPKWGPCAYVMVPPPPKRGFWDFLGF